MPRYLIERRWDDMDDAELEAAGAASKKIAMERFPQISWEHSHVVMDASGTLKSFCIYSSPNEDAIRAHAEVLGRHIIQNIYEIGGDVSPADFTV
jgi:hypothetical protein